MFPLGGPLQNPQTYLKRNIVSFEYLPVSVSLKLFNNNVSLSSLRQPARRGNRLGGEREQNRGPISPLFLLQVFKEKVQVRGGERFLP